jgi:photosystem I subunit 2
MVASALSRSLTVPQQSKALVGGLVQPVLARPQEQRRVRVAAETQEKPKEEKKEEKKPWSPPTLDPNTPAPIFGGSTGGLLRKAQEEEFYVITWEAKKEEIFEMPTGGAAIANKGPNLLKLARKEQCLALLALLRTKFKTDGVIYRVFPNGEVQHLHPKDGVYPEKVNAGRQAVGTNNRSIGKNTNPVKIKFTGKGGTYDV